jgi:hypothetical protein
MRHSDRPMDDRRDRGRARARGSSERPGGSVDQRADGSKGNRKPGHWLGWNNFGSQVRAQVREQESGPEPVPEPEHLNLIPDNRDLGPENDYMAAASYPVSGFPLSSYRGRVGTACRPSDAFVDPETARSARSADPTHIRWWWKRLGGENKKGAHRRPH